MQSVKAICRFSGCSLCQVFMCEKWRYRQELKHNQEDTNGWEWYDPPRHLGKVFFHLVYLLRNRYDAEGIIVHVYTRTTCWELSVSYFLHEKVTRLEGNVENCWKKQSKSWKHSRFHARPLVGSVLWATTPQANVLGCCVSSKWIRLLDAP